MARRPILEVRISADLARKLRPLQDRRLTQNIEGRSLPRMRQALRDFLREVVDRAKSDRAINSRTGNIWKHLYAGISAPSVSSFGNLYGMISAEPWAAIHETGGRITPKTAEVLTIPMPAALYPDGRPKRRGPKSWKSLGTFSYQSKRTGQGYLAYKQKTTGKLVLLYVYVDAVTIRARLGLRRRARDIYRALVIEWGNILAEEMAKTDLMKTPAVGRSAFTRKVSVPRSFTPSR
jgi:hypothetical protein